MSTLNLYLGFSGGRGRVEREGGLMLGSDRDRCLWPDLLPRELKRRTATSLSKERHYIHSIEKLLHTSVISFWHPIIYSFSSSWFHYLTNGLIKWRKCNGSPFLMSTCFTCPSSASLSIFKTACCSVELQKMYT